MKTFLLALSVLLSVQIIAQEQIPSTFEGTHHMLSPEEMELKKTQTKSFTPTPPPAQPRSIAEFEQMEGVIVGYPGYWGIPVNLVSEMAEVCTVYTIVESNYYKNQVINYYTNNGVNMANCKFVVASLDSYWSRDYSPWFIADSLNDVAIVNFPYNRPRPNDDDIPIVMAAELGVDLYGMNLEHTGGNYMTDGMGIAASTDLVETENSNLTTAQINDLVLNYLGVHTYHLMDDPLGAYIEHIDCWGKFLDVNKVLIGEVPSTDPRYQDYEATATYFATTNSSYGTPYEVYRVYSPNGQPYTNSLILNNKVLVPIVSGTGSNWNDTALTLYEKAMPGYEIVGITQYGNSPWESTDALHCRTHGIPDRGMLYIKHIPLQGDYVQDTAYEVRADIISYSDSALYADSLYISYRYDQGPWHTAQMVLDAGNEYVGYIPDSTHSIDISYFVHAADQSGRFANHPYQHQYDPHSFYVKHNIGVEEQVSFRSSVLAFPNPCNDQLFIWASNNGGENVNVAVYSSDGRLIEQSTHSSNQIVTKIKLNPSAWPEGIYFVEVFSANYREVKKIVVNH